MMRKMNKAELMKTYSADSYHVIDGCVWVYRTPWPKIGKLSDLYRLFLDILSLDQGGTTVIFDDYTQENAKAPE